MVTRGLRFKWFFCSVKNFWVTYSLTLVGSQMVITQIPANGSGRPISPPASFSVCAGESPAAAILTLRLTVSEGHPWKEPLGRRPASSSLTPSAVRGGGRRLQQRAFKLGTGIPLPSHPDPGEEPSCESPTSHSKESDATERLSLHALPEVQT